MPKILKNTYTLCIPLTPSNQEELWEQLDACIPIKPDFVEWRRDYFTQALYDVSQETSILKAMKDKLEGVGLIFTYRSPAEGGVDESANIAKRLPVIVNAIKSGAVDYVDVEHHNEADFLEAVRAEIKKSSSDLILSFHDFNKAYAKEVLLKELAAMDTAGADVLKVATTPQSDDDLRATLAAALDYGTQTEKPIINISMGTIGLITRVFPDKTGGSLTFGAGPAATASGQMAPEAIRLSRASLKI